MPERNPAQRHNGVRTNTTILKPCGHQARHACACEPPPRDEVQDCVDYFKRNHWTAE